MLDYYNSFFQEISTVLWFEQWKCEAANEIIAADSIELTSNI